MFAIVIDSLGYKVEFVHLMENGQAENYTLKENEQLIGKDWQIANSMNLPKWNFDLEVWEETEEKENEEKEYSLIKTNQELTEELDSLQHQIADLEIQLLMSN